MKIKKAILTGGGRGTRLHPVTTTINKHLLPLANKPMIFHAIEKVAKAGITDIFINLNPGETELQKHIGDGGHWGVNITYFEQEGGPQGIAHVVKQAEKYIGNDPFIFYLSDNVVLGDLSGIVDEFHKGKYDCMLTLSQVPDPERFGVPYFDDQDRLINVVEKPSNPPNNFAVIGIYVYGPGIFFDAYDNIEKSARGEYEISDIHAHFLKKGMSVGYKEITGWWKDTGKPKDLLLANKLLLDHIEEEKTGLPYQNNMIHEDADIRGHVQVGLGTQIGKDVQIIGPVIIAENCILNNCTIGPHVTIGQGTEIARARVENAIILDNVVIDWDVHVVNSIIGKSATLIQRPSHQAEARQMIIGDKTRIEL